MSESGRSDPQRWARVGELFHQMLELPPADRAAFYERVTADEPSLAAELRSLLVAHERAAGFLEQPAATPAELDAIARSMPVEGREIGPYRLRRVLGEGGMGVVYLAEDTRLGRLVALKAVSPRFAGDARRVERLRREARAAASLNHPGIATVYALDEVDGQLYLAAEYVQGDTLRDVLTQGPLGVAKTLETGTAIARALAAAHAGGIVHRDLKPENIALTMEGGVKVLDFGLAWIDAPPGDRPALTEVDAAVGTPAYMSPEQIRGGPVDARSDVFSLGVLLYELASGHHPFKGGTQASTIASILEDTPTPLVSRLTSSEATGPGRALDRVVQTAVAKAPDARYQTMLEVADALLAAGWTRATDAAVSGRDAPATMSWRDKAAAHQLGTGAPAARWWWQFHQATTCVAYLLLLAPLWGTRQAWGEGDRGMFVFLVGLVAAVVSGALRLHLWFASRHYLDDWVTQHRRSRGWILAADLIFSLVLLAAGIAAIRAEAPAVLMVAAAAAVTVSFTVIEPATTRAAFGVRT